MHIDPEYWGFNQDAYSLIINYLTAWKIAQETSPMALIDQESERRGKMKHKKISERVVMYIMSRSLEELSELTCYQVAREFKINYCYLSSKFKKDTKISLFDFIEQEKIIRIRILLKTRNDLTVADLSKMFGLEKAEQFRERFKKYFFITPGKYMAHLKNSKH
jgi:AraC-like DNA-binding protein